MRASGPGRVSCRGLAGILSLVLALAAGACSRAPDAAPPAAEKPSAPPVPPKPAKKEQPAAKASKPAPAADEPGAKVPAAKPGEEARAPDAAKRLRLAYKFHGEERLAWQVRFETDAARGGATLDRVKVDGTRFILCAGPGGQAGTFRLIRENPAPMEEIAGGKPAERRALKDIAFLLLDSTGEGVSGRGGPPEPLLIAMGDLRLPPGEVARGDAWTVERDVLEGRFLFRYRVESIAEEEGRPCFEVSLAVELPGGVPCGILAVEKARASLVFDAEAGVLQRAQAEVAFTRGSGPDALACKGLYESSFLGKSPATPSEAEAARKAADAWFDLLRMLEGKMYARAQKRIDEFMDETSVPAYALAVDALRLRIPDTRYVRTAGLLDRKRFDFTGLGWNPDSGPPIVLQDNGPMADGKPRTLEGVGKPAPAFWWKSLLRGGDWTEVAKDFEGKALLVHVWASWVPPSAESVPKTAELLDRLKDKPVRLLGITFDTERKDLDAFLAKIDVKHATVWDEDQVSVKAFALPGAPAFLVLDKSRVVRFGEMGWFGDKTLERLEKALREAGK